MTDPIPRRFAVRTLTRIVARCACCRASHDEEEWRALNRVGLQDDGDGGWLELRDCACGSTLSRALPPQRAHV